MSIKNRIRSFDGDSPHPPSPSPRGRGGEPPKEKAALRVVARHYLVTPELTCDAVEFALMNDETLMLCMVDLDDALVRMRPKSVRVIENDRIAVNGYWNHTLMVQAVEREYVR